MVLLPDPELFTNHQYGDMGLNPGKPTWGPYLTVTRAIEHETQLTIEDPLGAAAWDRKADARRAAWLASSSAKAFDKLGVYE